MAVNVLTINFRQDDSQTTQTSHRVTWLCCQKRCPRIWILIF